MKKGKINIIVNIFYNSENTQDGKKHPEHFWIYVV